MAVRPTQRVKPPSVPKSGDAARTSACATRTALRWPIRRPRMVLSDVDIKRYIEAGKIKIAPDLPPEQFGSCSVDFRLGNEFNVFEYSRHPYIDLRDRTRLQLPKSGDAARTSACATRTALRWPIRRPRMVLSDVALDVY